MGLTYLRRVSLTEFSPSLPGVAVGTAAGAYGEILGAYGLRVEFALFNYTFFFPI